MTSIAEAAKGWSETPEQGPSQGVKSAWASPPASAANLPPVPLLLWLKGKLTDLGLSTEFLAEAERLADQAADMRGQVWVLHQEAEVRRNAVLNRLAAGKLSLAAAAAEWTAEAVWLDKQSNSADPLASSLADKAARQIETRIGLQFAGHAPRLFSMVQRKAGEVVVRVAALPKFPRDVWQTSDPAGELAKYREHHATWGVLLACWNEFLICHEIADLCRPHVGAEFVRFQQGATRAALWVKDWRSMLADPAYDRLTKPLKLRYAIDHGWQPGLWGPGDVVSSRPEDRTFSGRLRNLGVAVGVNG